jgi:hypothetical protein
VRLERRLARPSRTGEPRRAHRPGDRSRGARVRRIPLDPPVDGLFQHAEDTAAAASFSSAAASCEQPADRRAGRPPWGCADARTPPWRWLGSIHAIRPSLCRASVSHDTFLPDSFSASSESRVVERGHGGGRLVGVDEQLAEAHAVSASGRSLYDRASHRSRLGLLELLVASPAAWRPADPRPQRCAAISGGTAFWPRGARCTADPGRRAC